MTSERNPQRAAKHTARQQSELVKLKGGVVTSTPTDTTDAHAVEVRPDGMDRTIGCMVAVDANGDEHLPMQGTDVVVAFRKRGRPVIVGVEYTVDETLDGTKPGERRLSHPLSTAEVFFDENGVLHAVADDGTEVTITNGEIHLGGSNTGIITDIDTTKDSDGRVIEVTPVRSNTVKF